MKVTVRMNSISRIVADKGLDSNGRTQLFHTNNINRRIGKYMPHLTGVLETKQKRVASPTTIEVLGPQAKVMYYGVKMVDSKTGRGPANIPDVGFRFRKGAMLKATTIPLNYTKTFNPKAGPYWDRRLLAAERSQIAAETTAYLRRKR